MNIGDKVFDNKKEVGIVTYISKESVFVTMNADNSIHRFHKFLYGGFLKTRCVLPDFDTVTSLTF